MALPLTMNILGVLLLLLLHFAEIEGECLPDAIPSAGRRNLTALVSSELQDPTPPRPLGIFTPDSAAAKAKSAVLEILVEERLGYLWASGGGLGTTTLDAIYAISGCNQSDDTLICTGETSHHVTLDGWTESHQPTWDLLQQEYPQVAPRNLGNVGYLGTRSIYLSADVQRNAYQVEGLPLNFYLSYNSSHDPARYFDQLDVSNQSLTSRLKSCNETRLMSNSLMAVYLQATGDSEGVDTLDDLVQGRCFAEFFWYAPACRDPSAACLMFFTGGDGWGLEDGMHKSAAWNMPLRIAVAKTDQDYAALPTELLSVFYWWVPDATFLALEPMEIVFPPHDFSASRRGDLRSAAKQISVDKYVSYDLQHLAPRVVQLVEAFQMDLATVNFLLQDQMTTGESYSSVACRWLQANMQTWQVWLPKAFECLAGFGIYDNNTGSFMSDPSDPIGAGDFDCRACAAGAYSSRYRGSNGSTFICMPCPEGTAQEAQGSLSCDACDKGTYQDRNGSISCTRCSIGSYQDAKGQSACKDCPVGTTSIGPGAQSIAECGCNEGTIDIGQDEIKCVRCSEGLQCPVASSLNALRSGTSLLGDRFLPQIRRGYQSSTAEPLKLYKCRKRWHCPGSVPGQCASGRTKIACAQCPPGQTWMGASCSDCNLWVTSVWVLGILIGLIISSISYYIVSNHISAQASMQEAVGIILLVLLNAAQCLGIMGLVDVPWPPEVEVFFSTSQIFIFDLDLYGLRCIMGSATLNNYLFTVALIPLVQLWLVLSCVLSSWLPKDWQWSWPKVTSTMGSLLLSAFSTMSVVAMAPFMCYSHPNGAKSLFKYPEELCGEPGAMQTVGLILLTLYVAGFWVVCAYGACCLPTWMLQRRREMVLSFRFLIFRLRVDSWWFEVVWMLRGPTLVLVILLLPDLTASQIYTICLVFALFLLLQTFTWPWKVPIMNVFDLLVSLFLLSLMVVSPSDAASNDSVEASAVVMAMFALVVFALVLIVIFAITHRRILNEQNVFFNLGYVAMPGDLTNKLQFLTQNLQLMEEWQIERAVAQMSVHDLRLISASLDLLVAELIPPQAQLTNPSSTNASRRISVQLLSRSQTFVGGSSKDSWQQAEQTVPAINEQDLGLQSAPDLEGSAPAAAQSGLVCVSEELVQPPAPDNEDARSSSTSKGHKVLISLEC